jgi:hypothetical protein
MKWLRTSIFSACLLTTFGAAAVEIPAYDISVSVSPAKPNGDEWDVAGEPDIFVCFRDGMGQRCLGSVTEEAQRFQTAVCRNTMQCELPSVPVMGDEVWINVKDKDAAFDDNIGAGKCKMSSGSCNLGLAQLTFRPTGGQ